MCHMMSFDIPCFVCVVLCVWDAAHRNKSLGKIYSKSNSKTITSGNFSQGLPRPIVTAVNSLFNTLLSTSS